MMGRHKGVLKQLKDVNPDMMAVHCIIHRQSLAAATLSPKVDQMMKKVIKLVNLIKAHPKTERFFKAFCQEMNDDYVRLLHTHVRWLSKGNCLERFITLHDTLLDFGGDLKDIQFLKSSEPKSLISYFADIFGKSNVLNNELQGKQKTLMDCKTKICGFISKLKFWKVQILKNNLSQFTHLSKCEPSNDVIQIISQHLSNLHVELNRRFTDLKHLNFPSWITQPFIFNCENSECQAMESDQICELMELQNNDSMKPNHASKKPNDAVGSPSNVKYNKLATQAQLVLLPFPIT